jgi:hypothetical protein
MSRFGYLGVGAPRAVVALIALVATALLLAVFAGSLSEVLTRRVVDTTKAIVATCAALLLLVDAWLRWRGRADRQRAPRDLLLVALALASALAWWNFLQLHYPHYIHFSDTFHYYVGSKYFSELGYTRLYACTAIADAEAGPGTGVADRTLRNLATNRLEPTSAVLADPDSCKRHFSSARWSAFEHDVAWFRKRVSRTRWHAIQRDHGYNAPPSWGILGGWLANLGPASDFQIFALSLIDPVLLALMWGGVAWAFGWRTLCVAVIYWGTNLFGVFGWNGGAFLRQGWLVTAIGGICCLKRDKPAMAGVLLTCSAFLRIFPGAILVAVGIAAAWAMWRERRFSLAPAHRRLAMGCVFGAGVIASLSLLTYGGREPWTGFVDNSRVHLATPLKNHVGLSTVLAYDAEAVDRKTQGGSRVERYEAWRNARRDRFAERTGLYWALLAAFVALLALAVRDQPAWLAAVLGIGLIPTAFELTNYYYAILLGYGLLSERREIVGAALCGVAAVSWAFVERWQWQDEFLTWCSAMVVVFAVFCTALSLRRTRGPRAPSASARSPLRSSA